MSTVATLDGFSNGTVVVERGDALRCQRLLTKEGGRHGDHRRGEIVVFKRCAPLGNEIEGRLWPRALVPAAPAIHVPEQWKSYTVSRSAAN
jgi:hypothetical protein